MTLHSLQSNPIEYVSEQKPGVNKSVEDGKMPTKKVKVDLAHRCTIFLCHLGCEMINTNIQWTITKII